MSATADYHPSTNRMQFTVNPVFFSYCGNILGQCKFNHAAIMKLRSESGYRTSVSVTSWNELATTLLEIPPPVAQRLFNVFYAVTGGCIQGMPSFSRHIAKQCDVVYYRHDNNRSLLNMMGGNINEKTWAETASSRFVSMSGLIMFISAQFFLSRSSGFSRFDDLKQAEFLKTNIHDYITAISIIRQDKVTPQDISDLEFILRQYVDGRETPVGAAEDLFPWQKDDDRLISVALLSQFIRQRIVASNSIPNRDERKLVLVDLKDTIYLLPQPLSNDQGVSPLSSTCDITRCVRSSIYIPSPLPNTRITHMENCTVVLGPVVGVLLVENCKNCSITALCGAVVVSECENVQLYTCPNTPPVLLSGLQNVLFGPYNTFYAMMSKDCQDTGINPILNMWNINVPSAHLMSPERYTTTSFLVSPAVAKEWSNRGVLPTTTNICRVPSPYQRAMRERLENFQNISNDIRSTYKLLQEKGYTAEANLLRGKIHSMFLTWLHQNMQAKALADLLHQPDPS